MAKFNGFILTEKGRELLAKGLAGETITFTKMAIGDGTSLTSERERTTLVNQITTLPILNINVKRNGTCEINALLTNKSVTTGFYIKELGIFAHGNDNVEILYAYNISTSPDFVPPFSANNVVEIEYVDTIIVDQVANVTAVIDPSITYITKKYADENYLVSSRLAEILGLEFGGNIQDIGNKTKGKFYYDSVTKFYYECIEDNSLTYNDSGKFRAISNKPISDKLENLFIFGNNYIKFPNGLIIQWGTEYLSSGAGTTINLKVAFKTANYSVSATDGGAGTYILGISDHQINSFRVFNRIPGTNLYATGNFFRWIAVGY
jgi:hypothetical protein